MPDYQQSIDDHYGQSDLCNKILEALKTAGKDIDALTKEDLHSFDQFHSGGLTGTKELASLAGISEGMKVLDVGSGIGGPARILGGDYGCDVTGIDLTQEFCLAAEMLTARVGLDEKVRFHCGSALDMPFEDGSFDLVWMQNSSMNIPDKEELYSEVRRVLRPGGKLATQDVLSGPVTPLHYPVPWAGDESLSFMISAPDFQELLGSLGFKELAWNDVTALGVKVRAEQQAAASANSPDPLGQGFLMAKDQPTKAANMQLNHAEGRAVVVTSVFRLD